VQIPQKAGNHKQGIVSSFSSFGLMERFPALETLLRISEENGANAPFSILHKCVP